MTALICLLTLLILLALSELISLVVPRPFRLVAELVVLGPVGWLLVSAMRGVLRLAGEVLQA